MVQNPPHCMAKKHDILHWDIENKGKASVGIPVFESTTFLPSSVVDSVPCDQLVQKAHYDMFIDVIYHLSRHGIL